MLVLSRKAKQRIVIGDNIELVVIAVSGDRVRIGINAPSDVSIYRDEVHRRIQAEQSSAAADPCSRQMQERHLQIVEQLLPVPQA